MEIVAIAIGMLIVFGLGWLLGHFKSPKAAEQAIVPAIEAEVAHLMEDAKAAVIEVEERFKHASDAVKHFEAVEILKLKQAGAKAKDIGLAIELAVRKFL